MKIFIVFFFALFSFFFAQGQTKKVVYSYDLAGNRIKREIVMQVQVKSTVVEEKVYTERLAEASLHIYPNPTEGLLKIELKNVPFDQKATFMLYDMTGQLILKKVNVSVSEEINISDKPSGTYILKISSGEIQSEWKIIKK